MGWKAGVVAVDDNLEHPGANQAREGRDDDVQSQGLPRKTLFASSTAQPRCP